ncbi:MAG TPA: hypothetical protein VN688_29120 [Gemmataceae bacterium]|nr:hypothetical protein [Gemmataceae bacterium]
MKRTVPLFVLVGAAGVLVPVLAVFAQTTSTVYPAQQRLASSCCSPAVCTNVCTKCSAAKAPSTDDKLIEELTAILKETKSSETFLVTAMTLGRMGPAAKCALPALIRNAERLELLEGFSNTNASADNQSVSFGILAVINMIFDKKGSQQAYVQRWQMPREPAPAASCVYGTPAQGLAFPPTASCPVPPAPAPQAAPVKSNQALPSSH